MIISTNIHHHHLSQVFKDARDLYHAKGDKTGWKKNDDEDDDDDGDLCLENLAGDGLSRGEMMMMMMMLMLPIILLEMISVIKTTSI